jgi:hypothetical protein
VVFRGEELLEIDSYNVNDFIIGNKTSQVTNNTDKDIFCCSLNQGFSKGD